MRSATGEAQLASTSRARSTGGRARQPAPRGVLIAALLALGAVAIGAIALLAGGSSHTPAHARFGGLPSWLPKVNAQVGRVLSASASHPALSLEGEAITVTLAGGSVLATAVGPEVPEEGRFPVPALTPATFIVTFLSRSGEAPLNESAFTFTDEQGKVHHPSLTAVGGGAPPSHTTPGRTVSIKLHDILPTGDGALSWTPEGPRPIASWDYTVEID